MQLFLFIYIYIYIYISIYTYIYIYIYISVAECKLAKPSAKSWLRRMGSAGQRSLHSIQAHFPTTASSAQFCLLCYQPEPVPRSLAARLSQLTSRDPCRLQAW